MGRIRLVGTRRERARCAYCRDRLTAAEGAGCSGCGALTHAACREELGGCPTLGCAQAAANEEREPSAAGGGRDGEPDGGPVRLSRPRPRPRLGRVTRRPPGLWTRLGPYSRMVLKTLLAALAIGAVIAALGWTALNPAEAYDFLRTNKHGERSTWHLLLTSVGALTIGGSSLVLGVVWLLRVGELWRRVGELLDDGRVLPMRIGVRTLEIGRNRRTYVDLDAVEEGGWYRHGIRAGLFSPWWLSRQDGERVYVHGAMTEGPYLLEFDSGVMALLDPS